MRENKKKLIIEIILIVICIVLSLLLFYKAISVNVVFMLNGEDTIEVEYGDSFNDPGFTALVNNRNISDNVVISSDVDESKLGNYTVKYNLEVKYLNYNETLTRKVKIVDKTAPVLTVNSEGEVTINRYSEFTMPSYEAYDDVDGIITDKIEINSNVDTSNEGTYEITFKVKDSSNNETSKTIKVNVVAKYKTSYIEVSITNQTLNYYENGELVLTSPVVTGINNGTPTGNFKVLNKATNVNLKGADYISHVNYWIAFIGSSYGMHDASWRSTFGGTIYKYNGSHGCVNMPYYKVQELYNLVEIGTPVYIKY